MRAKALIALFALSLAILWGCDRESAEEPRNARAVYFLTESETGRQLGYEVFSYDEDKPASAQVRDVIAAMRTPLNENSVSLLEGVELDDVQIFGGTAVVRFSDAYNKLPRVRRSLLDAAVTLSVSEVEGISYVRVTGSGISSAPFRDASSILLADEDLRLTAFEIDVYPVRRETGELFRYHMRVLTEKRELTPAMVLAEMISGSLGAAAPFEGRMALRAMSSVGEDGYIRADIYVPGDMELKGRNADVYSIVNSLCSCRGVSSVGVYINGSPPSDRGLEGCDGPMRPDESFLGE